MTKPDGNWSVVDTWKEGAALNEIPFCTALPLRTCPSQPSEMAETQRIFRVACRKTKQNKTEDKVFKVTAAVGKEKTE